MSTESTSPLLGQPATGTDERIGRIVEVMLDLLGVSKQALAEQVGMKPQTLGQKISGNRPWSANELERVAAALGFPVMALHTDPAGLAAALREPLSATNYRSA
jgi:hypothetical protein